MFSHGWRDNMGKDVGLFEKIYEKGEVIFHQGDPGDEMHIIQSGAVEVSSMRDGCKVVLTILEKEDFFGEMALIAGEPRSASAKVCSPVRLRSVRGEDMLSGIRSDPETGLFFSGSHRSSAGDNPGARRAAKITEHPAAGRFTDVQGQRLNIHRVQFAVFLRRMRGNSGAQSGRIGPNHG